jgi:hypothetical protein
MLSRVPPMRSFLACLIVILTSLSANAQTKSLSPPSPAPQEMPLRATLTGDLIKQAVKQSLAEEQKEAALMPGKALSADRYGEFGRQVSEARIPDCLHGDALKFQPTLFGGLLGIPFVVAAALRGKCR